MDNNYAKSNTSTGLSPEEVTRSRAEHGSNMLTPPKKTSLWKLYAEKYKDPIIQILIVAALISLGLAYFEKNFVETIGIFVAIFLATTIGFYFERDAAKKFDMLTALGEEAPIKVRRGGKVMQIPRHDIVVGDIVIIETGDEIPADGRLTVALDLQIDESSLTGEPITSKHANPKEGDGGGAYPADIVLRSTMVMNGRGEYQVTAVGDATEIGKVAQGSTEMTYIKTPLNTQLEKLAQIISKWGMGISVATFVIFLGHDILTDSVWHGSDYLAMAEIVLKYFMMTVTLIVMAVPEGLPMAVTLSLALNMRRMLKSNNLVRKLHACETMGAVTVICTDKTGTLTQNKMTVSEIWHMDDDQGLDHAIALNTTAHLGDGKGIGNPTEAALLLWIERNGKDYRALRREGEIIQQLPFSTERKYMATIAVVGGRRMLYVKGAPEIVMSFCDISEEAEKSVRERLRAYQCQAMRTLAFAFAELGTETSVCHEDLTSRRHALRLQGVAAISDPIREDVPEAVEQCIEAGIEVKIVTGDTSATAIEIARQIGIWDEHTDIDTHHITGTEFASLSDDEAYKRVKALKVMSRARPTDKQRLVNMLQRHGDIVAVTGDGTNDAPALHHAHVGLSLGSSTSVAKEASDMTLLDDSFRSIVHAVMWGRSLYKNIQRFLYFQLVVNVTALLLVLGGSFIGTEMPLTVTQILWVNLIMDTFAAMALASLSPSKDVMKERPRCQDDFIITKGIMGSIGLTGGLFFLVLFGMLVYCLHADPGIQLHELSMFFTVFVMLQFWNLFNAATLGTSRSIFHGLLHEKGLQFVLVMVLAGQWAIVTFGGEMFRTTPLSDMEWVAIIAATSVVLWAGELTRLVSRRRERQ